MSFSYSILSMEQIHSFENLFNFIIENELNRVHVYSHRTLLLTCVWNECSAECRRVHSQGKDIKAPKHEIIENMLFYIQNSFWFDKEIAYFIYLFLFHLQFFFKSILYFNTFCFKEIQSYFYSFLIIVGWFLINLIYRRNIFSSKIFFN